MLRAAVGSTSTLHRATESPAPRAQFGHKQSVAGDGFRATCSW